MEGKQEQEWDYASDGEIVPAIDEMKLHTLNISNALRMTFSRFQCTKPKSASFESTCIRRPKLQSDVPDLTTPISERRRRGNFSTHDLDM